MSKEEEYFNQFKNYYISNLEITDILESNNEKDLSNNKWSEELFYAMPKSEFIEKWETLFGYNDICKTMKLNEDIKIIDQKKDKIIELLVKNKGLKSSIKDFDVGDLRNPLLQSIGNKDVFPYSDFYLVTKNVWDTFDKNNELLKYGKIKVRKGYRKIMINHGKYFTVFFLDKNKKENDPNAILKKNLTKIVIYYENNPNEWIEDVIRLDIFDWFKLIEYPKKGVNDNKKYTYKDNVIYINKKDLKNPSFDKYSTIQKNENEISKSDNKDIIKILDELEYNNSIMIKKIRNATFIIASMYSLSQIEGLFRYFNNKNKIKIFNESSDLLTLFREYLYNLWKKAEGKEKEEFTPMEFIRELNKYNKESFGFEKEKEPKVFLEFIIQKLNEQLNDKDEELKKEIYNSKKNFSIDKTFSDLYQNYIKNHNSIMSKLFYGIFHIKNECKTCGKYEDNKIFNLINIDINEYINSRSQNSSLIEYYFDDLIDFYFNVDRNLKNEANDSKCPKCKQNNNIAMKDQKTIILFPEILIFSINWGNFDPNYMKEENNLNFDKNEEIDLSKYSYSYNKKDKDEIKYRLRSVIDYPIANEENKDNKAYKKFITISRQIKDQKLYSYQPSGPVQLRSHFCKRDFLPFAFFYEKIKS